MREMNHEILALISDFFVQVIKSWPKTNAAAAIEQANYLGIATRFMMILGISDLPRS